MINDNFAFLLVKFNFLANLNFSDSFKKISMNKGLSLVLSLCLVLVYDNNLIFRLLKLENMDK